MDQALHDPIADVEANPTPQHAPEASYESLAAEQVGQMGLDPALSRFAMYMTTLQLKSNHESKLCRDRITAAMSSTTASVTTNTNDILQLKVTVKEAGEAYTQVQSNQDYLCENLAEIKAIALKSYNVAVENKQHNSKGNFIVSGEGIPPESPDEDLFDIVFSPIFEKYGVWVFPQEIKEIHRLPNNRVFFSLSSRLPGYSFGKLVYASNSNPKPRIKVYVGIQLFEPYKELRRIQT